MNDLNLPLNPKEMNSYFAEAYNSGVLDNLTRLFEKGAKSLTDNGKILSNLDQIRDVQKQRLYIGGKMISENKYCLEFDNIALLRTDWIIKSFNADGKGFEIKGSSFDLVRKQSNGTWLYIAEVPLDNN